MDTTSEISETDKLKTIVTGQVIVLTKDLLKTVIYFRICLPFMVTWCTPYRWKFSPEIGTQY
ncbi:MAG TPA: hypothetical protein VLD84_00905 [Nitrososphaeraceae archaeon]|nr:hypothetical protein [Nitrososphaeraceae archaeon]